MNNRDQNVLIHTDYTFRKNTVHFQAQCFCLDNKTCKLQNVIKIFHGCASTDLFTKTSRIIFSAPHLLRYVALF